MTISHYQAIAEVLMGHLAPSAALRSLLNHALSNPSFADARHLDDLPYEEDIDLIVESVRECIRREPIPETVTGLWFGLFEPTDGSATPGWSMYMSGSVRWQPHDTDFNWAVSPEYWPDRRYLKSRILRDVYAQVKSVAPGARVELEYLLVLGYSAIAVREVSNRLGPLLAGPQLRGVAVGFDSGDAITVATLGPKDK